MADRPFHPGDAAPVVTRRRDGRRRAVLAIAVLALLAALPGCRSRRTPNVVFVITDDQRWDQLDTMPAVQSELVASGVSFTNAFVPTSMCCPSRASILTGQFAHTTGVRNNFFRGADGAALRDGSTLATWLHAAGYRTGFYGKYLNSYGATAYVPPGWDDWHAFRSPEFFDYQMIENGTPTRYGHREADYSTDVLLAKALTFIRANHDRRFFVWFAPYAPHLPATPAPRHAGRFAGITPWRPAAYDEPDVSDKPAWIRALPRLSPEKQAETDATRQRMLESLLAVDEAVAAIMATLREIGRDRDTLVVFVSDNGFALGEHRWVGKQCPYEDCVRVPLIIRDPALVGRAREEAGFAMNVDLAPTVVELTGATPTHVIEGRSLVPLLLGKAGEWRGEVLGEYWGIFVPTFASVRDARWKYVEYLSGAPELYDLANDPSELTNVAGDSANAEVEARLGARMRQLYPRWPWHDDPPAERPP